MWSFKTQQQKIEYVKTPEEMINNLPKWSIKDKKPSAFWNKGKDYIQVVLLSKNTGQKTFWAELDGLGLLRINNRAYKVPKENIYGDVFIWDSDKMTAINELITVDKTDAEDSFHELQMFNMAYSVGRQAGANELDNKLRSIFMIAIISLLVSIICAALIYSRTKDIMGLLTRVQDSISNLPQLPPKMG